MAELNDSRENWGSRPGFILAAIGCAVGLGNVWRFPHECYSNGGSAFLIPYIIAMVVIGIPLLIMEFSIGHLTRLSTPYAFRHVGKKWEFAGWWPIMMNFTILTYYSVIIAWVLNFFIYSFTLAWEGKADTFFFQELLQNNGTYAFDGIRWPVFASLAGVWIIMYFCIFKGVEAIGKLVLIIVPIPWLMLVVLVIRGVTLDGAIQGLEYYLEPDWAYLARPDVWRAAFGQVFFSVTIAFGVMITYASFLPKRSDISNNAMIIAVSDLATSFIAGLVVFSTMGALAFQTGQPVEQVLEGSETIGLAFVAFPKALSALAGAKFFAIIFFFSLLLLGIDSGFSMTQTTLACLCDKTGWKRGTVLLIMSFVGFAISCIFATRGGLQWLGTIDGFVNESFLGVMFLGLVQCLILGWSFGAEKLREHANKTSDWQLPYLWVVGIRFIIPVIIATLVIWNLVGDLRGKPLTLDDKEMSDPNSLITNLQNPDNPLAVHLITTLSDDTLQKIASYTQAKNIFDDLTSDHQQGEKFTPQQAQANLTQYARLQKAKKALTEEFNEIIEGPVIYEKNLFENVEFTDVTKHFIAVYNTSLEPVEEIAPPRPALEPERLNRLLLQEAVAGQNKPPPNLGGYFIDARGQLVGSNVLGFGITLLFLLFGIILALWKPKVVIKE